MTGHIDVSDMINDDLLAGVWRTRYGPVPRRLSRDSWWADDFDLTRDCDPPARVTAMFDCSGVLFVDPDFGRTWSIIQGSSYSVIQRLSDEDLARTQPKGSPFRRLLRRLGIHR